MNEYDERSRHQGAERARKPNKLKSFVSTITAGMIGSAITLAAVSYADFGGSKQLQSQTAAEMSAGSSKLAVSPASAKNSQGSIADIIEKSSKSIVGITNYQQERNPFPREQDNEESGSGSGVIFKKTGNDAYIVTNNHVIEGASKVEVSLSSGEKMEAEVIGTDALTDLAVLKIDAKHVENVIEFGDSSSLRPGDQVLAIGNPLGLDLSRTVTQGIVSAVDRSIPVSTSAGEWEMNVIQTDAAINPGNSGGALINTAGQVIGINSLKIAQNGVEGLGFAIPSEDVLPIVTLLIEKGKVERPYLGVSLADLGQIPDMYLENLPEEVESGTMITSVAPGSAASKAGLQEKDVIVAIDGEKVEDSSDLRRYMYKELKTGDQAELEIYKNGEKKKVQVTLRANTGW
ncbi:trypsin-like peptidase domain-containing protein [Bacillus sp. REN3]|uniref:S1C family serine protease n=1 Tax=Bacillus sp. REN3 TaxID=2802440 RepID=UPI001AED47E1|nr:trypsin-like peptidase domain-containing protein [Bacillus sp. REN3]